MNYVFFETGNKDFFEKLMGVFCLNYVENILGFYDLMKEEYGDKWWDGMKEHLASMHLDIFNCAQHLGGVDCPHDPCKAEHTAVLEFEQYINYGNALNGIKNEFIKDKFQGSEKKTWMDIESIFVHHTTAEKVFNVEFLPRIISKDHNEFLRKYAKETNKKKTFTGGYYYVRAKDDSDYDSFIGITRLRNVTACDALQSVV